MKVLFTRPSTDIPFVPPPMGPLYLASCLRKMGEHEAMIIDGRLLKISSQEIIAQAEEFDPDVIGISSLTMEGPEAHKIAELSKRRWPDRLVLLGGPYTTSSPDKAMSDSNIDFCFYGEAEDSFPDWVKAQLNGESIANVNGLAYRENGQVKITPRAGFIYDLDEIPFPAWDLIDLEKYWEKHFLVQRTMNPHQKMDHAVPMVTSRGCPYNCTYCHNIFGKKVRKRSVENVIREMELLKNQYGVEEIEFIDDIFNLDIPRAKAIFRETINRKLGLFYSFPNGLRSDSFDEELMDLMKEAGVYRIVFAVESGSKRMQKLMKKNLNLEKANANITLADKKGFFLGGFFIMGFPDETEEEVWETINFALKSKLHTANFFILTPFPGTDVWQQALDAGMSVNGNYEHYYQVSVNLSRVPTERLEELRRKAVAKFFLNPKRIFRFITRAPNFSKKSVEYAVTLILTLIGKWKK